jgi:hypothetical protein
MAAICPKVQNHLRWSSLKSFALGWIFSAAATDQADT